MPDSTVHPTPPTPAVPLAALLAREDLALRQIAGPSDPPPVVHAAHTSEMADPYPYLLGGELLLSAGAHIPDAADSDTYFDDYVSRIVAAGGAALGFGLAPVHDTVPHALVEACDAHGLPLVEVPPRTTFSAVARAVWQLLAQARLAELRRVTEAQQSLAAAAARPDPVPSVLRQLAQRVGGWTALYGPEGAEIAAAGREPEAPVRGSLTELTEVVRPSGPGTPASATPASATPASATHVTAGTRLAAYALGTGFVLGVATPAREPGDHTIASVAAVLLTLLTGEQQSGSGAARTSALVRLLLGGTAEEVAPLLSKETHWFVVDARRNDQRDRPAPSGARDPVDMRLRRGARPAPTHPQPPDLLAATALGAALGSTLIDPMVENVRILVPADRTPQPQPGWTLGVSSPAPAQHLAAAAAQAARAMARARATRTALLRHGSRPGLAELVPREEAQAHARALLGPLAERPALVETLRAWLSLHGSWDRTAVALSVHRNTVRQRIARAAELLHAELDDPDVRMELWFALRQE
ncbi:helix-turn-helix domain-containing protein [Streptomyces fuscichromogenes]|uniref:PucR family transcriptional regulator n=1 Tax=Streptomyces fuscichromogenes TaxID=1324013 RepID=A0A917UGV9_9ACTN|nr:PucR family transcriptional regulator [Streptomyces fuscichromogenes]GGM91677.1 PucR family transcriptional regulator [Streptomyces fuscichromogenes]